MTMIYTPTTTHPMMMRKHSTPEAPAECDDMFEKELEDLFGGSDAEAMHEDFPFDEVCFLVGVCVQWC